MTMEHSWVILVSNSKYTSHTDALVRSLLNQGCENFSVVGKDCEKIEEIIDELAMADTTIPKFVTTTSHPDNSLDEVIDFIRTIPRSDGMNIVVTPI